MEESDLGNYSCYVENGNGRRQAIVQLVKTGEAVLVVCRRVCALVQYARLFRVLMKFIGWSKRSERPLIAVVSRTEQDDQNVLVKYTILLHP